VTKDEDFLDLSVARAFPPKVVCLAIGNASNAATAALLLQQAEATV
jgi:predicted nuclease of predicted toxin-antitoxin system